MTTPGYITPKSRLEKLRKRRIVANIIRMLERGDWERFLLKCKKAKHKFPTLEAHSGKIEPLLVKVNVVRMAIRFHVLVLAGEAITVNLPEGFDEQRAALNEIRSRSHFDALLMQASRAANIDGFSTFRVDVNAENGTVICSDDNMMMLPVGPDGPDMQPTVWERRWFMERKQGTKVVKYLRVERHSAGKIEQEVYEYSGGDLLVDLSSEMTKRVELTQAMPETKLQPLTETGVPYPLVTRVVHEYFNGEPEMLMNEHDLDLLDMVAAAVSRVDRTMEKHGTPKARVAEGMIDLDTGHAKIDDVIVDPDKLFEYIVQTHDYAALFNAMNKSLQLLATQLQISPALLGIKLEGGAMPDTFDKLRLEASNTLARGKTSTRYFEPALNRVFQTCSLIDTQQPLRGYAVAPVGVTMHPGLPKDQDQIVAEVSKLRADRLVDEYTAISMIFGETAAPGIIDRLRQEREDETALEQKRLMLGFNQGGAI